MNTELFEEVRTLASDVLGVPRSHLGPDATPEHIESWDSIQHVSLMVAIEEHFGVQFDPEEISRMESIGAIADVLAGKLVVR